MSGQSPIGARASAIVAAARSWIGTPFRHGAAVRGVGVDCGQLALAVYRDAGAVPAIDLGMYPKNWFIHRNDHRFEAHVERFFVPAADPPQPADLLLFRVGRAFGHSAIVVDWPLIVHADPEGGQVTLADALQGDFVRRERCLWRLKRGEGADGV